MRGQRGIALIMVLWSMAIMTLIAMIFSRGVSTDLMLSRYFINQVRASALAEAGIWRAAMMLLDSQQQGSRGARMRLDGTPYRLTADEGRLQVAAQSEAGLIDLNQASPELLHSLIGHYTRDDALTDTIVDAILDWRDGDSIARTHGAEDEDYAAMGLAYGARDGRINSTDELRRIAGVSQDLYGRLLPLVSIFSNQGRVSVRYAPREVLASLPDMTGELADSMVDQREQASYAIMSAMPARARRYIGLLKSPFIRIRSKATVAGVSAGITATIMLKAGPRLPVTIVSWREVLDKDFNPGKPSERP